MDGDDGAGPSSHPTQKIDIGNKSGGRLGAKSSGLQRSSRSQIGRLVDSGEPIVKVHEPLQSVLRGRDARLSRETHPPNDDRSRQANAVVASRTKSGSDVERSNAAEEMAPPDTSRSRSRMKSSTGSTGVQRIQSNEPGNLARKSGWSAAKESTSSRDVIAPSQSFQVKGSHTPFKSAKSLPSGTNAVAGPSSYHRDDFQRTERPIIDLTENPSSSQQGSSSALPNPLGSRNQPNRKTAQNYGETPSAGRRLSAITASESVALLAKSGPMKPHWQLDDEERAKKQENMGRAELADRDFIMRMGSARRAIAMSQSHHFKDAPKHPKSYVGHNLTLRKQGEPDSESDSGSSMEIDGSLSPPRKTVRLQQTGFKAARKREWPQPPLFEPDSNDEYEASSDEVNELDTSDSPSEEDQDSEESVDDSDIEDIVITALRKRSLSPAEIEILSGPPRPPSPLSISERMKNAIDALSLSSVRMQKTGRLPFLLRNLRRGFKKRCRQLGVPTEPAPEQEARLRVQYEYRSETAKARLRDWACPLCELHGFFSTREMLGCHLSWDHEKAPAEWTQYRSGVWYLRLTITDPPTELEEDEDGVSHTERPSTVTTPLPATRRQRADISSPFPFVTLSPPEPQPRKIEFWDSPTPFTSTSRDSRFLATPASQAPSSSHSRSARTGTTTTTATTSTTSVRPPRDTRYPTPPPQSNPLGPAAQRPYLPAKSEYGGPAITYSCRPGGECLYDLLNTLPLEPYGVLAWDVLDREDEIYDSDNVKDEYKVMHALWGRWIILNKNFFIKDYYKGTKAFIDFYWKMIHRAAGWDALRYWLLMLVVNRFITGAEVASLLKHYESLTGMDTWYN
ncbi:hypothetical protein C0995_005107 [Termitomyces sp. Mi166|nr:hypothetical protein C0995_005107 [Termitomyces sp. Mi166\